jgi:phosphonate transport system ATP-binding protein
MTYDLALELDHVTVRRGDVLALDDVSFSVARGERVALVGQSGAGKSTLLSLANTSERPTSGAALVFETDPASLSQGDRTRLRARIGTIHQGLHMAGALRVVHNVNAGQLGSWSTARALTSLIRPGNVEVARAALDRFGLASMLWRRTDELSGGERQRVALARLVVQQAELILADEPTASLDPARASDVLEQLSAMAELAHRTVIVSIHSFELARQHFDRMIGLRAGQVVFDLPTSQVTSELGARLYDLAPSP